MISEDLGLCAKLKQRIKICLPSQQKRLGYTMIYDAQEMLV